MEGLTKQIDQIEAGGSEELFPSTHWNHKAVGPPCLSYNYKMTDLRWKGLWRSLEDRQGSSLGLKTPSDGAPTTKEAAAVPLFYNCHCQKIPPSFRFGPPYTPAPVGPHPALRSLAE